MEVQILLGSPSLASERETGVKTWTLPGQSCLISCCLAGQPGLVSCCLLTWMLEGSWSWSRDFRVSRSQGWVTSTAMALALTRVERRKLGLPGWTGYNKVHTT